MLSEWATRRQINAPHQETAAALRTQKAPRWDADQWLDAVVLYGIVFLLTWLYLDVQTCLHAYEAMGPKMAAFYNPQCA